MLGTTKFKGIRKLANAQTPTLRADISGIVDDIGASVFASGSTLPSATADKWAGRTFFHTVEDTYYVCSDTLTWLPVGGERLLTLSSFGAPASGYAYDTAGGASYVRRSGKRIDLRLRIARGTGVLGHGVKVFQAAAAYLPAGSGAWPLASIQSGGAQSASVVGAVIDAAGSIHPLSPSGISDTLEVCGAYYIP